jgi:hypothetical protein
MGIAKCGKGNVTKESITVGAYEADGFFVERRKITKGSLDIHNGKSRRKNKIY